MAAVTLVGSGTAALGVVPGRVDSSTAALCVTPENIEPEVPCVVPGRVSYPAPCVTSENVESKTPGVVPGHVDSPAPGVMPEYVGFPIQSVTPEYVDALRTELAQREMPERILYLPYALADQAPDSDRTGLWAVPALDALRWAGLNREKIAPADSLERGLCLAAVRADSLERGLCLAAVRADSLEWTNAGSADIKATPVPTDIRVDIGTDSRTQKGTIDIRTDLGISTAIALDRLQELYSIFTDWDRAIVAYAQSPTAAAAIKDSTTLAQAGILRSLREAESTFAHSPAPAAFEGLETLAASRKAEREAQLLADSAARKARIERLRALQAANIDRITYTIRKGDTLGGIAARHKVRVADLKRWNSLSGDFIREGRKLVIYIR